MTTGPKAHNPQRLKAEAEKKNIEALIAYYGDLFFKIDKDLKIYIQGKNILDFDYFIFRPQKLVAKDVDFWIQINFLTPFLIKRGKKILNEKSFLKYPDRNDKLRQHLAFFEKGIPFIPSFNSTNKHILNSLNSKIKLPVLVKPFLGYHGKDVVLVENKKQLKKLTDKIELSRFFIQDFLNTGTDYRVVVVGNEALGAMQKFPAKGKVVSNIAAGGRGKKVKLTKELANLAKKASKAFLCGVSGVDIMYNKQGEPYVLEVNRKPQFEAFEKTTGINIAGKIIDYLLEF